MAKRMDDAGASYREIGRMLEESSLRPRRGIAWHAQLFGPYCAAAWPPTLDDWGTRHLEK